jgi:hypothetical protein
MSIPFVNHSPRDGESCSKQVAIHVVGKLPQGDPDGDEIIEARRALIAELEQRRRAGAIAA